MPDDHFIEPPNKMQVWAEEQKAVAVQQPNPNAMMEMVERVARDPEADVGKLKEIVALVEHIQDREADRLSTAETRLQTWWEQKDSNFRR